MVSRKLGNETGTKGPWHELPGTLYGDIFDMPLSTIYGILVHIKSSLTPIWQRANVTHDGDDKRVAKTVLTQRTSGDLCTPLCFLPPISPISRRCPPNPVFYVHPIHISSHSPAQLHTPLLLTNSRRPRRPALQCQWTRKTTRTGYPRSPSPEE